MMRIVWLAVLFPLLAAAQFAPFERPQIVATSNFLARGSITLGGVTLSAWPSGSLVVINNETNSTFTLPLLASGTITLNGTGHAITVTNTGSLASFTCDLGTVTGTGTTLSLTNNTAVNGGTLTLTAVTGGYALNYSPANLAPYFLLAGATLNNYQVIPLWQTNLDPSGNTTNSAAFYTIYNGSNRVLLSTPLLAADFDGPVNVHGGLNAIGGVSGSGSGLTGTAASLTSGDSLKLGGLGTGSFFQSLTVNATGSLTVNGGTTTTLSPGGSLTIANTGTSGGLTNTPFSVAFTSPSTNGWTRWVDFGTTNAAVNPIVQEYHASNYITFTSGYTNGLSKVFYFKGYTAPATCTVYVTVHNLPVAKQYPDAFSFGFREAATNRLQPFRAFHHFTTTTATHVGRATSKYNGDGSVSADYLASTDAATFPNWWRVLDDGTNRKCENSTDGINWITYHSVGRTDFATFDEFYFGSPGGGSTATPVVGPVFSATFWHLRIDQ